MGVPYSIFCCFKSTTNARLIDLEAGGGGGGTYSTDVNSMLASVDNAGIRSAIGVGTTDSPTFLGVSTTTGGVLTSGSIEAGNGAVIGGANLITVRTTNGTAALFRAFQAGRENWTFGISAASSSFDFLAAGTLRAQLTNTGNFSATSSLSAPVLTLTGQSLTGTQATSLVDLATTWNTSGTPTAIKLNVVETGAGSNAASNLMDLQVGGVSKFNVLKNGAMFAGFGVIGGSTSTTGVDLNYVRSGISIGSIGLLGFSSGNISTDRDTILARDAAGILAQRNLSAPQTLRVYNSTDATPATNFDRASFGFTSNTLRIGTENGGTYTTARPIEFVTGGVARWQISAAGHLMSAGVTDGLYDIGASYANRPKDIYAAGMISSAGYIRSSAGFRFLAGGSYFVESANGVLNLTDSTLAGFGRLQLGGTTSAFPAIKRNGTGIDIRLADDSAFAPLAASTIDTPFITSSVAIAITAAAGAAGISIGCSRFRINGNTSSFPAFKNVGTRLDFILADDTGFTGIQSLYQRFGSGTPEGAVTAPTGAVFHRTDGGSGSSFYVKESGSGSTGWVGK